MLITQNNPSFEVFVQDQPYVRLNPGAGVFNVESPGNLVLDKHSTVSRSTLGKYFGLGCFSYVTNSRIGRYCTFGSRVSIGAFSHPTDWLSIHEFQYRGTQNVFGESIVDEGVNLAPKNPTTEIGNDVWIGDNACIRFGTKIGDGAVIGMGAVVVADVPPYAIVVGSPARVLRYRFEADVIAELLELKWWEFDISELKGIDFQDVRGAIAEIRRRKGL
ncbi:CatB-related O-acetyltransferase [Massilia endophytica]|uniref:CatB-related O-acetyltransferase n=1 Tax=Massilia endophytica TaxID=2899220 RepID=UPI0022B23050